MVNIPQPVVPTQILTAGRKKAESRVDIEEAGSGGWPLPSHRDATVAHRDWCIKGDRPRVQLHCRAVDPKPRC